METLWSRRFSLASERTRSSAIRELLRLTENPEIISFAGGLPATEAFPVAEFRAAAERILSEHAAQALQYGSTEGYLPLREMIARHTMRYGIVVGPENILLTTGSQQALDLIGKVFINPGDGILTERPTYLGALQAWNGHEPEYLSLDVDDDGLDTRDLDRALRSGPKFIYLLPNFQNPTGVTLSLERRKLLVERADHYGIPIIEDDPYGQLRYEGDHLPPLVILDALARGDNPYSGNVIYLSTFSKILVPGLRLGWVVAPAEVIRRLVVAKQGADLHTSSFRPDAGLRGGAGRLPGRTYPENPRPLPDQARRDAGGDEAVLSSRGAMDLSRRGSIPLGHTAATPGRRGTPSRLTCRARRLRAWLAFFPRLTCEQHASSQLFERRAGEDRRGDSKAGLRPQAHAGFGKQASASSVRRCRKGASRFLSLGVLVSLSFSIL